MLIKVLFCASCIVLIMYGGKNSIQHAGKVTPTNKAVRQPNILFVIMDDWSWPHASAYGDKIVKTPAFDRVAKAGVLFTNTFCVSPSCTPSRGSILTGQAVHRLEEGGNLWSTLPKKFKVYPDALEEAGYQVGFTGKAWGPGTIDGTGRTRNPAGPEYNQIGVKPTTAEMTNKDYAANFEAFFKKKPKGQPFCFWYGSMEPHRKYKKGMGLEQGKNPDLVQVPAYLPDHPEVRNDLLDYYAEIEYADLQLGKMIELLEKAGELENTLIMITGDNGLPFPRSKANLYDGGTRLPLAVSWPARIKGNRVSSTFISFTDFAPTILEAAGLTPWPEMTGISFLDLLEGKKEMHRNEVFLERERHAQVRKGDLGYPCRAIRTKEFLYIRNMKPERWPAGDPEKFGDVDDSPTKQLILTQRKENNMQPYFERSFAKRPAEELYDLRVDSAQLVNVADQPKYADARQKLKNQLESWMRQTADPRANNKEAFFDAYPYLGNQNQVKEAGKKEKSL
ncbi:MAG: sulfatase [Chitinophagaceae bacterium]